MQEDAERLRKSKFITERGFVYPAPKEPSEFGKHPQAISEARAMDLRTPWEPPPSNERIESNLVDDKVRVEPDRRLDLCMCRV